MRSVGDKSTRVEQTHRTLMVRRAMGPVLVAIINERTRQDRRWGTVERYALRDPAERFLSDHSFMRGKRDRARSDCLDHRLYDLELAEFVAAIEARPEVYQHDYQCRQLADGRPDLEAARAAVDTQLWRCPRSTGS